MAWWVLSFRWPLNSMRGWFVGTGTSWNNKNSKKDQEQTVESLPTYPLPLPGDCVLEGENWAQGMITVFCLCIFMSIYLFWALLDLIAGCGLSVVATVGLLIAVASLVAEHMLLQSQRQAPEHRHKSRGAWVSCSTACRIFLDPGSNLCLLHWQQILNLGPSQKFQVES